MEELKKVALIAGNVLSILLGEDLPDPRMDIPNDYSYFNS
ncbi:unnamed protein product [marine sediment metagenome]|uniref:Uncharacterized protein n=1 Tax=marine sediment metagenome TaxID=412755 RepID=X1KAV7_9ZZZZ